MRYRYDTRTMKYVECDGQHLTQAQQEYFKNCKLRDEDGDLGVFYHYTVKKFDEFDPNTIGNQSGDGGYFGKGFYFTGQPSFNSCCWPDKEKGEELHLLQCYLNMENPFLFENVKKYAYHPELNDSYTYDAETFLRYLKDNSENGIDIVLDEDDFIAYMEDNWDYDEYRELINQYKDGEIGFYDEVDGVSLDELYSKAIRNREIIVPEDLSFGSIHRGLLAEYSEQITDYAKEHGFDGIVSDGTGHRATELVVFYPNQIKLVDNLYPTKSNNFRDNTEDYIKEHQQEKISIKGKTNMEKLNNIYQICNKEAYNCFMEDEWKKHNLSWYSSIDKNVVPTYEEMKAKLGNTREGNFYLRVVNNNINKQTEVIVHRSKTSALKDVKEYASLNVNDDAKKIVQPLRVERAEDLAISRQTSMDAFNKMLAENNYSEYELKAARAIARYGAEWHNHVNEMTPINQEQPSKQAQQKASVLQNAMNEAKEAAKAQKGMDKKGIAHNASKDGEVR